MFSFFLADENQDKYYNSLFRKRPDEDRDKKELKECSKLYNIFFPSIFLVYDDTI